MTSQVGRRLLAEFIFTPVLFIWTQYLFTLSLEVITVSNSIILVLIKSCFELVHFLPEQ